MIKADNYKYTKNIREDHISVFESDLKNLKNSIDSKYSDFLSFKLGDSLSDKKRKISQIYDFLYDFNRDFIIVFDGEDDFQIWGNFSLEDKKIIKEKFKDILKKNKKIKLFNVNKKTGLVSFYFEDINLFKSFKKSEATMDKVYKKELNKIFDWNGKKNKLAKKVQDYLKFKHDQLMDMIDFKNHNYKLEDRENNNFYKQVRNASEKILPLARIYNYSVYPHLIRRMEERNVAPKKIIDIIKDGKQLRSGQVHKLYIVKGKYVVVLNTIEEKISTVISLDYPNLSDRELVHKLDAKKAKKEKTILVKDLNNFENLEDLKKHMNITELDYIKDEEMIQKNKRKKLYSTQPLMSNPPYVGDMLEYIKLRQKEESKLASLLNDLISLFEDKLS